LEALLQSSGTAEWVFVLGHHGVYSLGSHGPVECVKNALEPLFLQYKVNVYWGGHDHRMQHFASRNISGSLTSPASAPLVQYFQSGAFHGLDQPVNFTQLALNDPTDYAPYLPCFPTKLFLWPADNNYTAAELVPDQDAFPRTIPDSGSDRGGLMVAQMSTQCLCVQVWSSSQSQLYTAAVPNVRLSPPVVVTQAMCDAECVGFFALSVAPASPSNGDHWYTNLGSNSIFWAILCFCVLLIAVFVYFRCCRKATGDNLRSDYVKLDADDNEGESTPLANGWVRKYDHDKKQQYYYHEATQERRPDFPSQAR